MYYYRLISSMLKTPAVDADALAFVDAAVINDSTQQSAINQLVIDLKTAGIWTKMKAIYPFVGGSAYSHKFNLKNPIDSNTAFRLQFIGGMTHSSNGIIPNGTDAYCNTFLTPSSILSDNNTHISYYSRSNNIDLVADMGCIVSAPNRLSMDIKYYDNFSSDQYNYSTGRVTTTNTDGRGLFVGSRTNSSTHKAFRNGSQIGTTNTGASNGLSNVNGNIYICTANRTTEAITGFSTKVCAFASIGDGLNDTESSNLYIAVQKFQTTLGRNV